MSGFLFFKQKTAYELRISDWSSDVCSSDLETHRRIEDIALREPDGIELDSEPFGYDGLAPGHRRAFTIPGGAGVCTYEILVLFEEEDCCSDPLPIGLQNLCDDPHIVVHD